MMHNVKCAVMVEIKIDAAVVFDWITNDSTCNLNHSSLIMNCRTLAGLIPQVKICHCFREANKCADTLARKGPSIQQDFIVFYSLPVDIAMLLFSDFSVLIALQLLFSFMIFVFYPKKKKNNESRQREGT